MCTSISTSVKEQGLERKGYFKSQYTGQVRRIRGGVNAPKLTIFVNLSMNIKTMSAVPHAYFPNLRMNNTSMAAMED